MTSRWWLVELHEDLEHLPLTPTTAPTTRGGVWAGVRSVNGVRSVTDLRAITLETLTTLLMSDEEFAAGMASLSKHERNSYNAIRAYFLRVRQPGLPEPN